MRSRFLTSGFRHNVKKRKEKKDGSAFQRGKAPSSKVKKK